MYNKCFGIIILHQIEKGDAPVSARNKIARLCFANEISDYRLFSVRRETSGLDRFT